MCLSIVSTKILGYRFVSNLLPVYAPSHGCRLLTVPVPRNDKPDIPNSWLPSNLNLRNINNHGLRMRLMFCIIFLLPCVPLRSSDWLVCLGAWGVSSYMVKIEAMLLREEFQQNLDKLQPAIDAAILTFKGRLPSFEKKSNCC